MSSSGDESEDGQSSNTHNDQDSDVSFENDTVRKLTLQRLKRKIGLNTKQKHKRQRFDAGTRLTKMK